MSKYCMSCGAANADSANVCSRCGKPLKISPVNRENSARVNQNNLKKNNLKWIYAVVAIAVAFIGVFLGIKFISPASETREAGDSTQEDEFIIQEASEFMKEKGFTSFSYKSCEDNIVTFDVNEELEYAGLSGEMSVRVYQETGDEGVTKWCKELYQKEGCSVNWHMDKLVGEWQGEEEVYETFSGTFTNTHSLTIEQFSDNSIELHYQRHRGYNDEIESWDGSVTLPGNFAELDEIYAIKDTEIKNKEVNAAIEGIYNIKTLIQIHLDSIEINGYNLADQNTMNVVLEKQA